MDNSYRNRSILPSRQALSKYEGNPLPPSNQYTYFPLTHKRLFSIKIHIYLNNI